MYQNRNKELEIISLYRGDYKSRFYLREISSLTKLPLKTCQDTLLKLEKNKILKSHIEGKNKYFSLNLENIKTKLFLLESEIHKTKVFLEKYSEFGTFLKSINTNSMILVFGSFANFKADKDSDLDLFIVSDKEEKLPFHLLPYKIHKQILKESSFRKAIAQKETLIEEIKDKHVLLNNHSSYINIMWENYGR